MEKTEDSEKLVKKTLQIVLSFLARDIIIKTGYDSTANKYLKNNNE